MADATEKTWTPPLEKVPRIRTLHRQPTVRRLLARLAEQLWRGEIDAKTANAITYTLATAAKVINDEAEMALAKRIAALEERAGLVKPSGQPARRLNG